MTQDAAPEEFKYTPSDEDLRTFRAACAAASRGEEEPAPEVLWVCVDCQKQDCSDDYCCLSDDVWNTVLRSGENRKAHDFALCLTCIETRLGRELLPWDFTEVMGNYLLGPESSLLRDRKGPWFYYFEHNGNREPWNGNSFIKEGIEEMSRRMELASATREKEMREFI